MHSGEYPILLARIGEVNDRGATLSGEFIKFGNSDIREFGFIYGTRSEIPVKKYGDDIDNLTKKIVLDKVRTEFSYILNQDITEGKKYYFKAFAVNDGYTSYSNIVSFVSQGYNPPDPEIYSVSPTEATDGTVITITGINFSIIPENIDVLVEEKNCTVIAYGYDMLKFEVPPLLSGEKMFKLRVLEEIIDFGPIRIMDPQITDYFPKEGYDETEVVLYGKFFGNQPEVFFGSEKALLVNSTDTILSVRSPLTTLSGDVPVEIVVSDKQTRTAEPFHILNHSISGISLTEGKVGDVVRISGEGFIQGDRYPEVYFDGMYGKILRQEFSEIEVSIPNVDEILDPINTEGGEQAETDIYIDKLVVKNGLKEVEYNSNIKLIRSWEKMMNPFREAGMDYAVATALGSEMYIGLGNTMLTDTVTIKEWWKYSETEDSWTRLSEFPGAGRKGCKIFTIDNKIYILYGENQDMQYRELWEYDTGTDIWIQRTSPPDYPYNYHYSSVSTYSNKAYVQSWDRLLIYDPATDQWSEKTCPDFNIYYQPFCYNLDGRLFWFFGYNGGTLRMYEYLPQSDEWILLKSFTQLSLKTDMTIFSIDGKAYFGGGRNRDNIDPDSQRFYEFDPESMEITEKEAFYEARCRQIAAVINGRAYVGMGIDPNLNIRSELWIFDPR